VPGKITVYLDNLRLRRGDGTKAPLWNARKDTRTQKLANSDLFKDVQVRVVQAGDVLR
jgi:hypothetical protein